MRVSFLSVQKNFNAPIYLDVHDEIWPVADVAAVVCINMIHIAAPPATEAFANRCCTCGAFQVSGGW
jgi:hypothetical protein